MASGIIVGGGWSLISLSGVIIDECRFHGFWVDGGELERIRTFIADGGLERAQNKAIEKKNRRCENLPAMLTGFNSPNE